MHYLNYDDGRLSLEGKRFDILANELGTPFFIMSESRLRANYHSLLRGLSHTGARVTIRYCAKTNNEAAVLSIMAACGSELLASHPAEASLALQCGFLPDRIAYQRPVLLEEEIRPLLRSGITSFHAYRPQDLEILERCAEAAGKQVKIALRLRRKPRLVNLSPLSFLSQRLGFRSGHVLEAARRIRDSNSMELAAIHFYQGTQQESPAGYSRPLREVARLAAEIQSKVGVTPPEINLGGGVPSGSFRRLKMKSLLARLTDEEGELDTSRGLEEFARTLSQRYREEMRRRGLLLEPAIGLEPGRSIVGDAGFLVTRVRAIQENWVFLDASHNYLGESPLFLTRRILATTHPGSGAIRTYHLSGNTLNTRDVIDLRRRLPKLSVGDLLVLCGAGAYSISRASRYAGLCPPVYLIREDGSIHMIRRAEEVSDLSAPMLPLADERAGIHG